MCKTEGGINYIHPTFHVLVFRWQNKTNYICFKVIKPNKHRMGGSWTAGDVEKCGKPHGTEQLARLQQIESLLPSKPGGSLF
jgi:hypothetical protein